MACSNCWMSLMRRLLLRGGVSRQVSRRCRGGL